MSGPWVAVLVADGLRYDTLQGAIAGGEVPALARMAAEGAVHALTTVFPSVTGVGYAPMLTGRFPGPVGLAGLRWYDRRRAIPAWKGHSRSYVGVDVACMDRDLDPRVSTLWEIVGERALAAFPLIRRGLSRSGRLDRGPHAAAAAAWCHVRGDVRGWLAFERALAARLVERVAREQPRLVFAAFPGIDKASHAAGQTTPAAGTTGAAAPRPSPLVLEALRTVDAVAGALREDAERNGRWRSGRILVVSDHGHASVARHDELADRLREWGHRVRAHPFAGPGRATVAVMVSGNAMAHVYVDLARRERPFAATLEGAWAELVSRLESLPSTGLLAVALSGSEVEVRAPRAGRARIAADARGISYRPLTGDPLGVGGGVESASPAALLERTACGPYPDGVVQILSLATAPRSGDIVLSAAPGWDYRARWEPVRHVSSHGGLHREQMRVPLVLDREASGVPGRTADIFPSILSVLGLRMPPGLDGCSFL